jgi:hypothetical protein
LSSQTAPLARPTITSPAGASPITAAVLMLVAWPQIALPLTAFTNTPGPTPAWLTLIARAPEPLLVRLTSSPPAVLDGCTRLSGTGVAAQVTVPFAATAVTHWPAAHVPVTRCW